MMAEMLRERGQKAIKDFFTAYKENLYSRSTGIYRDDSVHPLHPIKQIVHSLIYGLVEALQVGFCVTTLRIFLRVCAPHIYKDAFRSKGVSRGRGFSLRKRQYNRTSSQAMSAQFLYSFSHFDFFL